MQTMVNHIKRKAYRKWSNTILLCIGLILSVNIASADTLLDIDGSKDRLILPNIDQQEKNNAVDQEDFEVMVYSGSYSLEEFDNQLFLGLKGSLFFTSRIFLDAEYGTSFLRGTLDTNEPINTRLNRYGVGLGYNLLKGKVFLGSGQVLSNELYVKYARGNIDTADTKNNYNSFGVGIRVLGIKDKFSFHTGASKDNIDSSGGILTGSNLKLFAGLGMYF